MTGAAALTLVLLALAPAILLTVYTGNQQRQLEVAAAQQYLLALTRVAAAGARVASTVETATTTARAEPTSAGTLRRRTASSTFHS